MSKASLKNLLPGMRKLYALSTIFSAFLILGVSQQAKAEGSCQIKTGYVSWYGSSKYVRVATGKVYNHDVYFAASKTLPFGTLLVVENPRNKKSVLVKIADRGPFVRGRSLDLSYGAAKAIGILNEGVARVKIIPANCSYAFSKKSDLIKDIINIEAKS